MWMDTACRALRERRVLELRYDGYSRCVEVHAVGYSQVGVAMMRAWQVRGGSASGEKVGWKLMRLSEALGAILSDEASQAPRKGHKRGDPGLARIVCEL